MPKIIVTHVYPPIPVRQLDWQAHYDGDEPNDSGSMSRGSGHGRTKDEAVKDLLDNFPPPCLDCEGKGGILPGIECATCEGSGERIENDMHDPIIQVFG